MDDPGIQFLGHSTVLIELGGLRVITDPVLRQRVTFLGRVAGHPGAVDPATVDVVLISHLHHDHADAPSLRRFPRETTILVPEGASAFLARLGFVDVHELPVGATWQAPNGQEPGIRITATPAVHDGRRTPFGPRAGSIGFLMQSASASVYFAGDTDIFDGMADVHPHLDVALLPVWGWGPNLGPGHMDPLRAAQALALLRPRYAVPIHWGTLFPLGLRLLGSRFASVLDQPPQLFAAHAARTCPECEVLVTPPGGAVRSLG